MVSIIIPVYNREKYIDASILSAAGQTERDIEIVVVDDGSTDRSGEICDKWAERDRRIKVFHTDNHGVCQARNYAIERASGEYILPLDSDDIIGEVYVEKAEKILDTHPETGIVHCNVNLFGTVNRKLVLPQYNLITELFSNCITATAMFRTSDWTSVGGYSDEFREGLEDYDFWLSLISLGRQVFKLPETLLFYRRHGQNSISGERFDIQHRKIIRHHMMLYDAVFRNPDRQSRVAICGYIWESRVYYGYLLEKGYENITGLYAIDVGDTGEVIYNKTMQSADHLADDDIDLIIVATLNADAAGFLVQRLGQLTGKSTVWFLNDGG
jgi:glycosyltransferase involved in cell wall biosynthesis